MGSFRGHALPGSFFLFFGVWHTCNILRKYFRSLFDPARHSYENRVSIGCCAGRFPGEAALKLAATVIGIIGEAYTAFDHKTGKFTHIHNGQHITMFAFFLLHALVDLLYHFKVPALPPKLDYLSAVLAFAIEAILFMWHTHGRTPMDVQVHTFLTYAIIMCIVGGLCEMAMPNDVRPALVRSTAMLVQGTWFWQVGAILYPKWGEAWVQDDHEQMLIVTMMFTWHIAAACVFVFSLAVPIYLITRRRYSGRAPADAAHVMANANGPVTTNGMKYSRLTQKEDIALGILTDDDED